MADHDFAEWLRNARETKKLSQAELARESGLSTAQISRLESRKSFPGEESITAIAKALGFPVNTVYEKAGLLPKSPPETEQQRQLVYLYNQLPEDEQKRLVEYAGFLKAQHDKQS